MKSITVTVALLTTTAVAAAETPPPKRGVTLPAGALEVALTLELNTSASRVGEPVTIAPDLSYGVTPDLTVAVVHSLFAVTGFRARAGGGLCVTGDDAGCAHVYDNVGAEAWYSVARGPTAIAVGGGVHALSLDGGFYALKLGARLRHTRGRVGLHALPSVLVAVTEREAGGVRLNKDSLWIPVQATYKATPALTVGLGTGVKVLDLSAAGDSWEVPVGAMATYAIDPATTVGGSWVFGKLLAGVDNPPDPAPAAKGVDVRGVQLWCTRTF